MTDILYVDLESYYDKDYGLTRMTTEAYIKSPLFECIGAAVAVNDEEPVWFSGTYSEVLLWLRQFDWQNSLMCAHNCAFDSAILAWKFGITPKGYLDTMSMANALHGVNKSVSLANLCKMYGLPDKGTEVVQALGKRRKDFTPEDLAAYGEYCRKDVYLCSCLFAIMAPSFTKQELKAISLTIRMYAEPVLQLDKSVLEQHLLDVRAKASESLQKIQMMLMLEGDGEAISDEAVKKRLNSNPQFAALLEQLGATAPMKLSPTTGKRTYAFAKTDEAFTAMLDHDDPMVVAAVTARLGNKSSIEETRTLALLEIASRGALPFPLKYCGAAVTHRFSAWDGVNLQNLPRGGNLRRAIIAPKGYKIVAADLSNIELRLGLWLAGQEDKLNLICQGRDLYMDVAAQMYGKTYEEIAALGKKSAERTCGKVVSLSSIYGTGADKLRETLRLVGKVKVTAQFAQAATDLYRGTYTHVVDAWHEGKQVLNEIYQKNNYGVYLKVLNVTSEGMVKPNGLVLTYPDLRLDLDDKGRAGYTYEQKRGARDRVYGSKCFQRSTQSLARDIICEHMLQIDKKYHVVGTVHDEVVCVVAEDEVEEAKAFMLEVMRTPPWWAPDLPLDAEVGVGDNYADAK